MHRSIRHLALTAMAATALTAVLFSGAGTVSAPEPADLKTSLTGSTGATAAAYYASSFAPTNVLLWPATWTPAPNIAAGTPCSTYGLPAGSRTSKTIQAFYTLRRCV
jgi:hypothetical protein